jgi:hypothetical protein
MPLTNGLDDEVAGFVFPIFFDIGIHDTQHADGPKLEAHIEATAIPAERMTVSIEFLEGATVPSEKVEPNEDAGMVLWERGMRGTRWVYPRVHTEDIHWEHWFSTKCQWAPTGNDYEVLI